MAPPPDRHDFPNGKGCPHVPLSFASMNSATKASSASPPGTDPEKPPKQTLTRWCQRNTLGPIYSPPAGRLTSMPSPGGCFMSCAR